MQILLDLHRIELICLAGFMRLLTPGFVRAWEGRLLNIHPALLPAYRGLHTHERALADGVKIHGCTVHFVVPEMDEGPIIAQAAVAVLDDDTPETLAARVLAQEHVIYPAALAAVATGRVHVAGNRTRLDDSASGFRAAAGAEDRLSQPAPVIYSRALRRPGFVIARRGGAHARCQRRALRPPGLRRAGIFGS